MAIKKFPKEPESPPFGNVFENTALFTPVVSSLFCTFPLSEFDLHAASILQSILLNRLQCVLLSVPLSLYLTDCGSPVALNHIQVSVLPWFAPRKLEILILLEMFLLYLV